MGIRAGRWHQLRRLQFYNQNSLNSYLFPSFSSGKCRWEPVFSLSWICKYVCLNKDHWKFVFVGFGVLFLLSWANEASKDLFHWCMSQSTFYRMIRFHQVFVASMQRDITLRFELFLEFYWCPLTPIWLMLIVWDVPPPHNPLSTDWNTWDWEGFFIYCYDSKI